MISATFFKCDSGGHTRDSDMNYQLAKKGNNINTHDETQKYFNHKISVVIALALVIALSYFCDCLNLKCDLTYVYVVCVHVHVIHSFFCAFLPFIHMLNCVNRLLTSMMKILRKLIISVYIRMGRI